MSDEPVPRHLKDFVDAWEASSSPTEVATRLAAAGYWYVTPDVAVALFVALRASGVTLKDLPPGALPSDAETILADTEEGQNRRVWVELAIRQFQDGSPPEHVFGKVVLFDR